MRVTPIVRLPIPTVENGSRTEILLRLSARMVTMVMTMVAAAVGALQDLVAVRLDYRFLLAMPVGLNRLLVLGAVNVDIEIFAGLANRILNSVAKFVKRVAVVGLRHRTCPAR